MATVATRVIDAARVSAKRLADRDTPFLFDCWYVAGFAEEFGNGLHARTILGRPLVLFRSEAGDPVALSDRCVHRSFPLSKSNRDGDTIVCGYHGMRYTTAGNVIEVPGQKNCPAGIGVRSYRLRQQGPLVWIWMGDGEPAAELPLGDWVESPDWPSLTGYFHLPASYIALHENLLDLTHLSYLHAGSFGTPDYALAPYEINVDSSAGRFSIVRTVSPTRLPAVWAETTGLGAREAIRISHSTFLSPAAHVVTGEFKAFKPTPAERPAYMIRTAHLATPETSTSTHYFFHHSRDFCLGDEKVTDYMRDALTAVFQEDVDGLSLIEQMVADTPLADRYEVSLASDRPAMAMRRWLQAQVVTGQT